MPTTTSDPAACSQHEDCATTPETPVCNVDAGDCVACDQLDEGDAACAIASGDTPHCSFGSGECVECTQHDQCSLGGLKGQGACHIFDGNCFSDEALVIEMSSPSDQPDDLADLLANARMESEVIVKIGPFESNLVPHVTTPVALASGQAVALIGFSEDGVGPGIDNGDEAPALSVPDGATAYIHNLRFSSANDADSDTVACVSGRLDARRSWFTAHGRSNVLLSTCEARMENVFLRSVQDGAPSVSLEESSYAAFNYVTIVGQDGQGSGDDTLVECAGGSQVAIRNSLVLTFGGGVGPVLSPGQCAFYDVQNSVLENPPLLGSTNRALEIPASGGGSENYESWFDVSTSPGNLHLRQETIGNDLAPEGFFYLEIAVPQPGDDVMDIDGAPRDTSDVVGADVP